MTPSPTRYRPGQYGRRLRGRAPGDHPLRHAPRGRDVVEDVMAEPSWDMSPSTMLGLARRARAALLDEDSTVS